MKTDVTYVREVLAKEFKAAAARFAKSPTSGAWISLKHAMLAHQQADQLRTWRSDHQELCERLGGMPMGEWGVCIVEHLNPGQKYAQLVNADK